MANLAKPVLLLPQLQASSHHHTSASRRILPSACSTSHIPPAGNSSASPATAGKGDASVRVKAVATVKVTVSGFLDGFRPSRVIDHVKDLIGRSVELELVSAELDTKTGKEKPTIKSYARKVADDELDVVTYEAEFNVPAVFGPIGAVLVANEHGTEMFLKDVKVVAAGAGGGNNWTPLLIKCHSWLQPKSGDTAVKRVFFDKGRPRRKVFT